MASVVVVWTSWLLELAPWLIVVAVLLSWWRVTGVGDGGCVAGGSCAGEGTGAGVGVAAVGGTDGGFGFGAGVDP